VQHTKHAKTALERISFFKGPPKTRNTPSGPSYRWNDRAIKKLPFLYRHHPTVRSHTGPDRNATENLGSVVSINASQK